MKEHPSHRLPPEKRAELFRVASEEFAALGFKQASLNRIIKSVGMSKSSFYHFFANKTDLFERTLDSALVPLLAAHGAIDIDSLTKETLWPEVLKMAEGLIDMVSSSPEMITIGRMFYRSLDTPEERALCAEMLEEFTAWLVQLLKKGQELGLFRTDLPETYLIDCIMALGMAIDRWMLTNLQEMSESEHHRLNLLSFDLFRRLLEPR